MPPTDDAGATFAQHRLNRRQFLARTAAGLGAGAVIGTPGRRKASAATPASYSDWIPRSDKPAKQSLQAMWAVYYYQGFGYWTSVNSALATWAVVAGLA